MKSPWESKGEKIHARKIDISTYEHDPQRIVVEGSLRDERFQDSFLVTGESFSRGVIHHMTISLLVNSSTLVVEDVSVCLSSVPRSSCRETADSLALIKGLSITRGFMAKVKKIAGGNKGCTHLVELLQAMAPAVFQGVAAFRAKEFTGFEPLRAETALKLLAGTCHAWREDGPLVKQITALLDQHRKDASSV